VWHARQFVPAVAVEIQYRALGAVRMMSASLSGANAVRKDPPSRSGCQSPDRANPAPPTIALHLAAFSRNFRLDSLEASIIALSSPII
jgi:hypothetical protein